MRPRLLIALCGMLVCSRLVKTMEFLLEILQVYFTSLKDNSILRFKIVKLALKALILYYLDPTVLCDPLVTLLSENYI